MTDYFPFVLEDVNLMSTTAYFNTSEEHLRDATEQEQEQESHSSFGWGLEQLNLKRLQHFMQHIVTLFCKYYNVAESQS